MTGTDFFHSVTVNGREYVIIEYAHFMYAVRREAYLKRRKGLPRLVTVYRSGELSFKRYTLTKDESNDVFALVNFMRARYPEREQDNEASRPTESS